jgi:hypothetical protein
MPNSHQAWQRARADCRHLLTRRRGEARQRARGQRSAGRGAVGSGAVSSELERRVNRNWLPAGKLDRGRNGGIEVSDRFNLAGSWLI